MEIGILILGAAIGGLISWGISHVYYSKSNQEQEALFNKLTSEVRTVILEDKSKSLNVRELNELLEQKTIKDSTGGDPLPYQMCPKCGSTRLNRGENSSNDDNYYFIQCEECEWSDWTQ